MVPEGLVSKPELLGNFSQIAPSISMLFKFRMAVFSVPLILFFSSTATAFGLVLCLPLTVLLFSSTAKALFSLLPLPSRGDG